MLLILLLIIIFISVFTGLALVVAKAFILGLILLPVFAVVGFFVFRRRLAET